MNNYKNILKFKKSERHESVDSDEKSHIYIHTYINTYIHTYARASALHRTGRASNSLTSATPPRTHPWVVFHQVHSHSSASNIFTSPVERVAAQPTQSLHPFLSRSAASPHHYQTTYSCFPSSPKPFSTHLPTDSRVAHYSPPPSVRSLPWVHSTLPLPSLKPL